MQEIWKPILGYENLYEISNYGNVKSLDYRHTKTEKVLSPRENKNGYLTVNLWKNGRKEYKVHRLVWEAFNGKIQVGVQINHINEDKKDNCLSNLNLMTPKENCNWGSRNKRIMKSILCYSKEGVFIREFDSITEASNWLQIDKAYSNICNCLKGRHKHAYGYIWKYS